MELLEGRQSLIAIVFAEEIWKTRSICRTDFSPLYGVVLEDTIVHMQKKTLEFFKKEGVEVKIISGDHVKTVSMIAKRAGLLNVA